jgi:hypothetical protein
MRNPDKRRFLNAARHIETEEIPLFEVGPDMALARRILGKDLPMDRLVYELPIADYVELNRRMGNDMIYFAHIWRLGRKQRVDAEGRLHYVDGMLKTPDDLKSIWFPDLDLQQRRLEDLLNHLEGTGMGVVCSTQSAPFVTATAMCYEDFWVNAKWRLAFVEEFIDILNPIEPCAGLQDIYDIKEKYGDRVALCGNIDVDGVLMHGPREAITREVEERIDRLAGGGGHICASSHDLHQLIPLGNFYAMRDASRDVLPPHTEPLHPVIHQFTLRGSSREKKQSAGQAAQRAVRPHRRHRAFSAVLHPLRCPVRIRRHLARPGTPDHERSRGPGDHGGLPLQRY